MLVIRKLRTIYKRILENMWEENTERELRRALPDGIPRIVCAPGAIEQVQEILLPYQTALLVCDERTFAAAGKRIIEMLDKNAFPLLVLPGTPLPDMATVKTILAASAECGALVAIGSGTINDLCKYAAAQARKPYITIATAPSMNGYASANASIIAHGHKQSFPARLPEIILCDLSIIARAPARLIRAGFGDSLARSTAQADWLLSHYLLETHYDERPFRLTAPYEEAMLEATPRLLQGDMTALSLLMKILLLSGLGMTIAGGSYPASQGEHMIAHTMEMKHGDALPHTYHGEQIGVTTLSMAKRQQCLMMGNGMIDIPTTYANIIKHYFSNEAAEDAMKSYENKIKRIGEHSHLFSERWQEALPYIHSVIIPAARIEQLVASLHAPTTPEALGWPVEAYTQALAHAKYSRDRFTFLDMESGT